MSEYSIWPYNVKYDLDVVVHSLLLDGNKKDALINERTKKINVVAENWRRANLRLSLSFEHLDDLLPKDERKEARALIKVHCHQTYFRKGIVVKIPRLKNQTYVDLELMKEDLKGLVYIDAFIVRDDSRVPSDDEYAEEVGQRLIIQGEEKFYWRLIVDTSDSMSGSDLETEFVDFHKDDNLKSIRSLNYYLDLSTAGKPVLYINKGNTAFFELWHNNGEDQIDKDLLRLQNYIDRDIMHDVYVQIIAHTLKEAEINAEYYEDSSPGYKEGLIQRWHQILRPELDSREDFIKEMNKLPDAISEISQHVMMMCLKPRTLKDFIKGVT